jgi:serine/threonine protein kinase
MNGPVDRTVVQQQSTVDAKTIVTGAPGLDGLSGQTTWQPITEGVVLKKRFELLTLLGCGGMGAVYKARDLRQAEAGDTDPWVAVKVINESFARHEQALLALQQESKKTQRLNHPNIVSAYDFDCDGDIAFMTMEWLQGQSLDQMLACNKSGLEKSVALSMVRQISDAIAYAHQQGIAHADLKPANIFITVSGQIKILDFGIARAISVDSPVLDCDSITALTPAYASVGVLCGERPDRCDDLYALGCIFYSLFTGCHPYRRYKATEAEAAKMLAPRIQGIKYKQWVAINRLLAFRPEKSASITDFQNVFFNEDSARRNRYALTAVLVFLLVVMIMALFNWQAHQRSRQAISLLSSADSAQLSFGITMLAEFTSADTLVILDDARDAVLGNLQALMQNLTTAQDFQATQHQIDQLLPLYSDSSSFISLHAHFQVQRTQFLHDLEIEIENRISNRRFSDVAPSLAELIQSLTHIDSEHPLLQRYNLKTLLAKEASLAMYLGHADTVRAIIQQAVVLFPEESEQFQKIQRQSQVADQRDLMVQGDLKEHNLHHLKPYEGAVALVQELSLTDPTYLVSFLQQLQDQNPDMYFLLKSSLQTIFLLPSESSDIRGQDLAQLKQMLFPENETPYNHKPVDSCRLNFAGRGQQSQYRCRDSLTRTVQGPEMVVSRGKATVPAFAVTRSEISVADFNHYCRLYRACGERRETSLPITSITYKQAIEYAQWLSDMSGYHYHLPSLEQWQVIAQDDSGIRDHNCKVYAGGRWVRGGKLRPVAQGYQNSLGLVNVFGNAEEWLTHQGAPMVGGGDADTEIQKCNPQELHQGVIEPAPMRGFRLVRELS